MLTDPETYIPGLFSCTKCEFVLVQRDAPAGTGPGCCPHCSTPLKALTWHAYATRLEEQLKATVEGRAELEAENTELRLLLLGKSADRRQWYIGQHLLKHGFINRLDVIQIFNVTPAVVSADIGAWMKNNPGAIAYNESRKRYELVSAQTPEGNPNAEAG